MLSCVSINNTQITCVLVSSDSISKIVEVALRALQTAICCGSKHILDGLGYLIGTTSGASSLAMMSLEGQMFITALFIAAILVRVNCFCITCT